MEEEISFTIGLILLLLAGIFATVTLVLSFKRNDRICCLGGGLALGIIFASLGFLVWGVIEETAGDFQDIFVIVSIVSLLLFTFFLAFFMLTSVIKKKGFCCLGAGIAFAGIGLGAGIILLQLASSTVGDLNEILIVLVSIIFLTILITASLVILISLKTHQSLCCFAGTIALAGIGLGISALIDVHGDDLLAGFGSLFNSVILLGLTGVVLSFIHQYKHPNH
ncbi:hypothetical protein WAK64_07300 [Bacillus spongiae]|uniref:DUF4203 domain-containing protein n=1 Tax=Bacillus spongiae TaxID=2683610 RepID=A0ABU8HC24_9BACI